jgi:EPS-associated MarR family transcriptional regulator
MLTDEYRYKLLRLLEANPQTSQRDLAQALGISVGRVNYCLNALIEKGHLKAQNFKNNKNKRAYMYYLTPRGFEEKARVTVRFFRQKLMEYEALSREIEDLRHEAANQHGGASAGVASNAEGQTREQEQA